MTEPFPSMDIFSPDDETTIPRLVDYLEEFQRRREALLRVKYLNFKLKILNLKNFINLKRTRISLNIIYILYSVISTMK